MTDIVDLMRVLDLFSGIGGFSLGLERAGMKTAAFCEIEPYCRAVLAKHWPGVPIYEDIRTLSADVLERDGIAVDAICGGFPCQDLSHAGKRAGLESERSGLWGEYRRLISEIRPSFVIVENVPGLLSLGMGTVLGDLSALGYDAVWDCVPASAVGAPHRRDRVWIVAHARSEQHEGSRDAIGRQAVEKLSDPHAAGEFRQRGASRNEGHVALVREAVAHTQSERRGEAGRDSQRPTQRASSSGEVLADTDNAGLEGRERASLSERAGERIAGAGGTSVRDATSAGLSNGTDRAMGEPGAKPEPERSGGRQPECGLGRVAHGFSDRLDGGHWLEEPEGIPRVIKGQEHRASRLKALGNAVVPQVVEIIGRAIMQAEASR